MKQLIFSILFAFSPFLNPQLFAQTVISEDSMWQAVKNLGHKNHEILCQVPSDTEMIWLIKGAVSQNFKTLKVEWRQPDQGDSVKVYFMETGKTMFVGEDAAMIDLADEPGMTQTIIATVFHCLTPEFDTFTNTYRLSLNLLINEGKLGFEPDSVTRNIYFSKSFDDGEIIIAAKVDDPEREVFAYWRSKNLGGNEILYGRVNPKGEVFWEKKKGDNIIRVTGPDWRTSFFMHWLDMIGLFKK